MQKSDRLDPDKMLTGLKTKRIGSKIVVLESAASTNDIAAEYAKDKTNEGLAIFAEEQTAGRGRGANRWYSDKADSLIVSIVLSEEKLNTETLSLTSAIATAEAISDTAKIKWPNDVIMNNKKVAGILLELKPNRKGFSYILGIGINCHQKAGSFPAELQNAATSIDIENGSFIDRNILAKRLLTSIDHWLETAKQNTEEVIERWRQLSIQLGHRIKLVFDGKSYCGNCIGVDPQKGLVLQLEAGGVRMFDAAHTSIAG